MHCGKVMKNKGKLMKGALAGTRIRERRRQLNLKQSALAKASGISASYLNLIEHNRRTVSGKVLASLARELNLPLRDLAEGAEASLIEDLRQVFADNPNLNSENAAIEEFIGRFPQWARIVTALSRQIRDNEATIATFADRQNFDPHLQKTLYEMITTITAIRSTAAILRTEDDIEPPQRKRFETVVHDESRRLSDAAQGLVSYFDQAQETTKSGQSAQEIFETFMGKHDHVFESLEGVENPKSAIGKVLQTELAKAPEEARLKAIARLTTYGADARAMPLEAFSTYAKKHSFSPDALAIEFKTDLHAVFRRLSTLKRDGIEAPSFGVVVINAAGQPIFRRPLEDFSLPRFSSICALWPAFQALSAPGQAISEIIVLPNGREFLTHAVSQSAHPAQFNATPTFLSAMLVTSLNDAHQYGMINRQNLQTSRQVGTSCRLCLKTNCAARSEPSILPKQTNSP